MAFNVCDNHGKHIGVIFRKHPMHRHMTRKPSVLVGLTKKKLDPHNIDIASMKDFIAWGNDCKKLFGKIKEDKLSEYLKEMWNKDFTNIKVFNYDQILKILVIRRKSDFHEFLDFDESYFSGYIMLDSDNLNFYDENTVILDENIEYAYEEDSLSEDIPLYCKITTFPTVNINVMGLAEGLLVGNIADLGGRNHTHSTKLNLISGNVNYTLYFPIHISAQKDMVIKLFFNDENLKSVFCGGVIYTLS